MKVIHYFHGTPPAVSQTRKCQRRSGVERQFEIMGEALSQLAKHDPQVVERISDYRKIIAFRNILIHAYATVDDWIVWGAVEGNLPALRMSLTAILPDS